MSDSEDIQPYPRVKLEIYYLTDNTEEYFINLHVSISESEEKIVKKGDKDYEYYLSKSKDKHLLDDLLHEMNYPKPTFKRPYDFSLCDYLNVIIERNTDGYSVFWADVHVRNMYNREEDKDKWFILFLLNPEYKKYYIEAKKYHLTSEIEDLEDKIEGEHYDWELEKYIQAPRSPDPYENMYDGGVLNYC